MTAAATTGATAPLASIRAHLMWSALAVVLLLGGVVGLFGSITIAGAVVAPAMLVVEAGDSRIEHPQGGTVGELLVEDGDAVRAGDVLLRIDDPQARAALAILEQSLDQLMARHARLVAERNGDLMPSFPAELDRPAALPVLQQERELFQARQLAQAGLKAQLAERIDQLTQQIAGLAAQQTAKGHEIALAREQRDLTRQMRASQLVEQSELTAIERDFARLEGERGALAAAMADLRGRIAEIRLQIIQIDDEFRSGAAEELSLTDAALAEARQRHAAASSRVGDLDIRAPRDGVVHQLAIRGLGGIVSPGKPIMTLVPTGDALLVEARVSPLAIDQLHVGQSAFVRLSALDPRTTPELEAQVSLVSADLAYDPQTGAGYYTVRLRLDAVELARLGAVRLVPGMPVETFIRTGDRTILSYLLKPLTDQMARSFRD